MPKRKKREKTAHDRKIERLAKEHERKGWKVRADILGYGKPSPIGQYGHVPDLEAKKKGRTRIFEVETPSTVSSDKKQRETFRRSASHRKNTTFKTVIVKPRKRSKKR